MFEIAAQFGNYYIWLALKGEIILRMNCLYYTHPFMAKASESFQMTSVGSHNVSYVDKQRMKAFRKSYMA